MCGWVFLVGSDRVGRRHSCDMRIRILASFFLGSFYKIYNGWALSDLDFPRTSSSPSHKTQFRDLRATPLKFQNSRSFCLEGLLHPQQSSDPDMPEPCVNASGFDFISRGFFFPVLSHCFSDKLAVRY